ncbi:MAG: HNH endonuclease, partial [bacterium]
RKNISNRLISKITEIKDVNFEGIVYDLQISGSHTYIANFVCVHNCQYCQKMKNSEELSLDHVVPKCQGGLTTWENIVVACTDCNSKKAGRTPKQAGMQLLRKPMKPKSNFFTGDIRIESWSQFLGENYWSIELENDNS